MWDEAVKEIQTYWFLYKLHINIYILVILRSEGMVSTSENVGRLYKSVGN